MQKFKWIILVGFTGLLFTSFRLPDKDKINWITLDQLNSLYAKNPKPILIDVYTDWCGWCKQMDRTTYRDHKLSSYINDKYYAVRFNAESTDTVLFNHKKYAFNQQYKTNDLALYLTFGRLEYPHTIFLSSPAAQPAPLSGYMKPKEMEGPLKFFGEKADASTTFVEFSKTLKKEW